MSRNPTIIEVEPLYALVITLCSNAETVEDGRDLAPSDAGEVTRQAVSAACVALEKIIPAAYWCDQSSNFSDWHGGRFAGRNLGCGWCHIYAMTRDELEVEEGDEPEFSDWRWTADNNVPGAVKAIAEKMAEAANAAMHAELEAAEKAEREYREENKAE